MKKHIERLKKEILEDIKHYEKLAEIAKEKNLKVEKTMEGTVDGLRIALGKINKWLRKNETI